MAVGTIKTGISIPRKEFLHIEKIRRQLGISRSSFFGKAISFWLKSLEEKGKIKQYVEGYKKNPESIEKVIAMEKASAEAFDAEGWK